jgi:peptide/nickel transport system permease protein
MLRFTYRRLLLALAVTLTLSIVTFVLLYAATDPAAAIAGEDATQERIAQVRRELGLDRSLMVQYFDWLGGVLGGNLGQSWYWPSRT